MYLSPTLTMIKRNRIYFDGNVWQKLDLDFKINKSTNPAIWAIFKEQQKGRAEIYCSDIHKEDFKRSFTKIDPEIVEEKIAHCFEKSNKVAKTIMGLKNTKEDDLHFANKDDTEKFNQLNCILNNKNENISKYSPYHLLICYANNIDVFLTYDTNILGKRKKLLKLFESWGKRNFVISTPEGYYSVMKYFWMGIYGIAFISVAYINYAFIGMDIPTVFLSFGLFLNMFIFTKIIFTLNKVEDISIIYISSTLNHIKNISSIFFVLFTTYSSFILFLATKGISNIVFSSLWLLTLIFLFQSFVIYIVLYMIKEKINKNNIISAFTISYFLLSAMFGWTSATLAHDVLFIPMLLDLTLATYGTLILLFIFNGYLEDTMLY